MLGEHLGWSFFGAPFSVAQYSKTCNYRPPWLANSLLLQTSSPGTDGLTFIIIMFVRCKLLTKDYLSLKTAFSGPKGWSLVTGFTVVLYAKHMRWTSKVNVPGHGFLGAAVGLLIGDGSGSAARGAVAAVYEKKKHTFLLEQGSEVYPNCLVWQQISNVMHSLLHLKIAP